MKLSDLIESKKPTRVCEYLKAEGIKFNKITDKDGKGATFELKGKNSNQTKEIVNSINYDDNITKYFSIGYAGANSIVVKQI